MFSSASGVSQRSWSLTFQFDSNILKFINNESLYGLVYIKLIVQINILDNFIDNHFTVFLSTFTFLFFAVFFSSFKLEGIIYVEEVFSRFWWS